MHKALSLFAVATLLSALRVLPAQEIPKPIQAPVDQQLYLRLHAQGHQIYTCKSESGQFAWTFKAPEAQLTDAKGKPFGFAGPTWQSDDGSSVTGTLVAKVGSGDADSIPWLLLNVSTRQGEGILSRAKTIQRVNTKGGKPLAAGCDVDHVNQEVCSAYSAEYDFYATK